MDVNTQEMIDRVVGGESASDVITEITKTVGGRKKRIDPKRSRIAKRAAKKKGGAARRAAAKKGARKKGHAGRMKAARKAQRTKKKFGSIGASANYTPVKLISEWTRLRDEAPDDMTEFKAFCETQIELLRPLLNAEAGIWEAQRIEHIDRLSSLYEAIDATEQEPDDKEEPKEGTKGEATKTEKEEPDKDEDEKDPDEA